MEEFLAQLQQQTTLEWIAVLTGIVYVVLAAMEKNQCWIFGIISTAVWAYVTYFSYKLYADAMLQIFYVGMGFYGLYKWQFSKSEEKDLPISSMTTNQHLITVSIGLLMTMLLGNSFANYTEAAATYLDSFTTVFSIAATIMTVHKKIENWIYWIVVNILYVYLYSTRGAILFAILMIIYAIIAGFGWINWSRRKRTSANQ